MNDMRNMMGSAMHPMMDKMFSAEPIKSNETFLI